jgi:hypothetical protein
MPHTSSVFTSCTPDYFRPDPRLEIRIAVRHALEAVRTGDPRFEGLEEALVEYPSLVEAVIERERVMDSQSVGALRMALGLEVNPWDLRAEEAVRIYESSKAPADKARFAAGLLQGETVCLTALALAVCRHANGLPLLVAMHAVAPHGEPRKELARAISQRHSGVIPRAPLVLNRDGAAFHHGFIDDQILVMIFRELPGHYTIFTVKLAEGMLFIQLQPITGEKTLHKILASRNRCAAEALNIDDCRAHLGAALAKLQDREASEAWRSLGHLLEERLFPTEEDGSGFVVGEQSARLLLDRLAQVLVEGNDEALVHLVERGSHAGVLMELYGPAFLQHVIGLPHGVSRVDAGVEKQNDNSALALVVGRTEHGTVLTRCEMTLSRIGPEWCISKIEVQGIGTDEGMYRPVWEILSGEVTLPIRSYGGLPEAEQELIVGLLDTGFRIDEIAAAVTMCRQLKVQGDPGCVAAACHSTYEQLVDTRPVGYSDRRYGTRLVELCERYEAELSTTAQLAGKLEFHLARRERFRDFMLPN